MLPTVIALDLPGQRHTNCGGTVHTHTTMARPGVIVLLIIIRLLAERSPGVMSAHYPSTHGSQVNLLRRFCLFSSFPTHFSEKKNTSLCSQPLRRCPLIFILGGELGRIS